MTAEKGNKVYTIDESTKQQYLNDGFDVKDDSGNVIAYGKGKTVPYEQYEAVLNERNALRAAQEEQKEEEQEAKPEEKPKTVKGKQ